MTALVCGQNVRHFEVVSEEMQFRGWSGYEPPEWGRCWGVYLARTKRDALILAVRDEEFRPWVELARSDRMSPFKGLTVKEFVCEHGSCVGCWPNDGTSSCPDCAKEHEESFLASVEPVNAGA